MDLTRRIRDKMMKERLMFAYRGVVTSENSIPLLMLLEKEMENSEFGFPGRRRLFMFVLESLQNVSRHTSGNKYADMSLVTYSKAEQGYTVTTGNVIPASGRKTLKEKLDHINSLSMEEIKEVYRQMINEAEFSSKGGAGLGLIEMAKKTGNKLDFDFLPIDNEYAYFVLSKTVDGKGLGLHDASEQLFHGKAVTLLERTMDENNINMIWCGHVNSDIGSEVLLLAETNMNEEDLGVRFRNRVFSILVELLDNVARYSPGKEAERKYGMPVVMIKINPGFYSITTGNLILSSQVPHLREKIEIINKYDKEGLRQFFIRSLSNQTLESDSTGNMGLIDMARKSGSKLFYQFEKVNDLYSYYIVTVKVTESEKR